MREVLTFLLILFWTVHAGAVPGENILGVWNNQEKDAKIEIYKCKDKYCGKIVASKGAFYPRGSAEGAAGTPRLDNKNPDPAKRSRRILGLQIMNGFVFTGSNEWKEGTLYDPKHGKTYKGKIVLRSPDKLVMRGYEGITLIGKNTTWTRDKTKR